MRTIQSLAFRVALSLMLLVGITAPAFAIDLDTARAKGLAGEVDNGLLAIPPGAAADAQDMITTINNSRRAEYAGVAAKNNLTLDVVGGMMFQKIYSRLPAGTWIQVQGKWAKKVQ